MKMKSIATIALTTMLAALVLGQTAPPTQPSAEQRMNDMLRPPPGSGTPLQPTLDAPAPDKTSGKNSAAVAPNTPAVQLQREGTYIFDRTGHLTHNAEGTQAE